MLRFKFHLIDGRAVETDDRSDSPMFGSLDNFPKLVETDGPFKFTHDNGETFEFTGSQVRSIELIFRD